MECFSNRTNSKVNLSIIVPMYNVEEYIVQTLNSMRSVDSDKVELILIDDGSTDNTLDMAKSWAKKNDNLEISILSKRNEGLSITRNLGIRKARGDFIAFFDGDDIALSYLYKEIIQIMISHEVDICKFRASSFDHITQNVYEFNDHDVWNNIMKGDQFKVLTSQQEPRLARLEPSAVINVYRKDFIIKNEIFFPEKLLFEDIFFHARCILYAKKIALLDKTLLLYRVNREGQITASFGEKRLDILKTNELLINEVKKNKIPDIILANILGQIMVMNIWCAENCAYKDKKKFVSKMIALFSEIPIHILEIYKNEYSYSDWERAIFKALIDKNENILNVVVEGGSPILDIENTNNIKSETDLLKSIDNKLDHLFSQQKDGWANDRFNVLNEKINFLIDEQYRNKSSVLKLRSKLTKKIKVFLSFTKKFKG